MLQRILVPMALLLLAGCSAEDAADQFARPATKQDAGVEVADAGAEDAANAASSTTSAVFCAPGGTHLHLSSVPGFAVESAVLVESEDEPSPDPPRLVGRTASFSVNLQLAPWSRTPCSENDDD